MLPRLSERALSNQYTVVDSWILGTHLAWSRPIIHIPSVDHIEFWPNHDHPLDPAVQILTTADDYRVAVNPALSVRIYDPLLLRNEWGSTDWEVNLCMRVRSKIAELYQSHKWSDIPALSDKDMMDALNEEISEWGVEVVRYCTEDRAETDVTRHYGFEINVGAGCE